MQKKIFSLILGAVTGIVFFSIILNISNNQSETQNNDKTETLTDIRTDSIRRNPEFESGSNFRMTESNTGAKNGMGMMGNLPQILEMTQDEIDKELESGKTIENLMEEKGINMENIRGRRMEDETSISKTGSINKPISDKIETDNILQEN